MYVVAKLESIMDKHRVVRKVMLYLKSPEPTWVEYPHEAHQFKTEAAAEMVAFGMGGFHTEFDSN